MTIPVGFAQITVEYRNIPGTASAAIVFGVSNAAAGTATQVAVAAQEAWEASLDGQPTADWRSVSYTAKLGPDDTGAFATAPAIDGIGADTPPTMPPNVAYLLHKTTELGGRRGRGRMYLPGVAEAAMDDEGVVAAQKVTDINGAAANLLSALSVRDIPMVVLHDPGTDWVIVNGQPRRIPNSDLVPAPTLVSTLFCDGIGATQRRRMR